MMDLCKYYINYKCYIDELVKLYECMHYYIIQIFINHIILILTNLII